MDDKLKAIETKALSAVEKHVEALALELAEIGKEAGDIALDAANPIVKIVYGATKEQLVAAVKALIVKLDLDKDGI